ncbi:3'-5' exonuclease [Paenibacillus sp. CAU 1782]
MSEAFTVIDIETTGLDHVTDHITEIAAIRFVIEDDGSVREIGRFQTFVALPDGATIPDEVAQLTGIRPEDLVDAPNIFRVLTALWYFAVGTTWVAHNAPFDFSFIAKVYMNPANFVCTRALASLTEPAESASLAAVCSRHGIALTGHHRAMNDAAATVQVFAKLRKIAEGAGIEYRNVVIDSDERPLRYVPHGAIVRRLTKEVAN